MRCCGVCSISTGHRFSPHIQAFSILRISPYLLGGHIKLQVPPKIDYMKHATTSDYGEGRRPDLSGHCLRHVCAAVVCAAFPPVIASCLIFRRVRVLHSQDLSRHFGGAHQQAKRSSEIVYTKHATVSDHDDRRAPDLSGDCLRHMVLWCVQ